MKTAIWWARRDLRLSDNQALTSALAASDQVVPVFILDSNLLQSSKRSEKRLDFLFRSLYALDEDLQSRGSQLIIREGEAVEQLSRLMAETKAEKIFAEADYSPYARKRDARVQEELPLDLSPGLTINPPGSVLKKDGTPYTVFTPFSRAWKSIPIARDSLPPKKRIKTPNQISSLPLPESSNKPTSILFPAGETVAQQRLESFIHSGGIFRYGEDRDRPDLAGTSQLSPYLRFGVLSIRQATTMALAAIKNALDEKSRNGATSWLNELIWREFYIHILYHFPRVLKESFRTGFNQIRWRNDESEFAAWKQGKTGYPIVDAGMRQLAETGWMHNRVRMITASFLVKDLLIDWRWGESWFMQNLIDGDPAANNGGWQWTAGTGTDAAPYFRIFNPITQGKKFDPLGDYVRQWMPELKNVETRYIHSPWEMPVKMQRRIGPLIGTDYPVPMVDHKIASSLTLAAYAASKTSTRSNEPS